MPPTEAEAEAAAPTVDGKAEPAAAHAPKVYEFAEGLDADTTKMLTDQAEWASGLMEKLVKAGGDDAMKPGICNACEGLAFIKVAKGGFGLTWAQGHGFVIRKLEQDSYGHSRWSAPAFFGVSQLGFGIAAGYESVESCLALMNLHSINAFTKDTTKVGTDLLLFSTETAMSGVPAGTFGTMQQMDVAADNQSTSFCYSLAHGALVNLSINGTEVKPDAVLNKKLYGETPGEDVLSGKSRTFKEMLPLYRKIHDLAAHALS